MKLATKSRLRSPKESMVPGDNFRNHDLAGPFKVAEKALHITSSEQPWATSGFCTSPGDPLDLSFLHKCRAGAGSLNFEEIRALNTLSVNGGLLPLLALAGVLLDSEEELPSTQGRTRCLAPPPYSFGTDILRTISRTVRVARSLDIRDGWCCWKWPSRSGTWLVLAIGWALLSGGLLALGLGRPAQTNKGKQPGRGRSKPLRRGDQTKAMIVGKRAQRRVVEYVERTFERWGSGLFIDGVMGRVHGSRRDPRKDKYGKISRRCRRHNWGRLPSGEYPVIVGVVMEKISQWIVFMYR
ncbi:hypothetical protein Acr_00g0058470 [Actinidia rufa]|uniref:Uncharacterized protein n=1 Tax=Actinidia rufa TaxID=165716 RepID=A0A7J0DN26_9ERIC|nr:hypothetical protein Acr_00g0058470 [Actinidia rufa]